MSLSSMFLFLLLLDWFLKACQVPVMLPQVSADLHLDTLELGPFDRGEATAVESLFHEARAAALPHQAQVFLKQTLVVHSVTNWFA